MGAMQWLCSTALLYIAASCAWHWNHVQYQQPACEMTYMYPSFNRIHSPALDRDSHRYALYEYRDGIHQPGPTDLTTPALFIPGNAGNYKQVRSIASETTRVWAAQKAAYPDVPLRRVMIQWFAIDTREEMSAFDGNILERQAEFTLRAIRYLAQRYNITTPSAQQGQQSSRTTAAAGSSRPHTHPGILLVGHSMGGVVAHTAWLDATNEPELGPSAIAMLLTLASPLQRPPLPSHPSLARFYASRAGKPQPWAPLISLSGGWNDTQVAHALTSPYGIHPRHLTLHVTTMAVPGAWLSPSHNVIVWCNQLLKPLSKFLTKTAWKLHYEPPQITQPDTAHTESMEGSEGAGSGYTESLEAHMQRPDHTTMILETARAHLLPHAAVGLPVAPDQDHQPAAATTHNVGLKQSDDFSNLPTCSGPNLAWYMQYIKPKLIKAKRGNRKQCVKSSTSRLVDVSTAALSLGPSATMATKEQGQGRLYYWDIKQSKEEGEGSVFVLRISGATPCQSWRLWLHPANFEGKPTTKDTGTHQQEDDHQQNDSKPSMLSGVREITHAAAWLPEASPAARRLVRQWRLSDDVMRGINYNHTASWAMLLPMNSLQDAARITLWVGQPTNSSAFHVIAQLIRQARSTEGAAASEHQNSASQHVTNEDTTSHPTLGLQSCTMSLEGAKDTTSTMQLSWLQLLKPVIIPQGSAAIHQVSIDLSIDVTAKPWSDKVCRGMLKLSQPLLETCSKFITGLNIMSAWAARTSEILQHTGLVVHCHGCCNHMQATRGSFSSWFSRLQVATNHNCTAANVCMHPTVVMPCDTGSTRHTACGDASHLAASNLTVFDLGPCLNGKDQQCRLTLLTDPACTYQLSLTVNPSRHLPGVLLAHLPSAWLYAQALLLLMLAIGLQKAHLEPTGTSTTKPSSRNNASRAVTQSRTQPNFKRLTAFVMTFLALLLYTLTNNISQSLHQAEASTAAHAAQLPDSMGMHTPINWTPAQFFTHEQLSIALWVSMLLPLVSIAGSVASMCRTSHSPQSATTRISSMLVDVMAAVIGCTIPWCISSPAVIHSFKELIRTLANSGLWMCSSVDCSTSRGPTLVEQLVLMMVAMAILQALSVCVAVLTSGLRFLFMIVAWPVAYFKRQRPKELGVATNSTEAEEGSKDKVMKTHTSTYARYGRMVATCCLLLLLALVLHVWVGHAVGLLLLLAKHAACDRQRAREGPSSKRVVQQSTLLALALYCIVSGPAGIISLTSWRDNVVIASSVADMALAAPWLLLLSCKFANVQQHYEVVQTLQKVQTQHGMLRMGCWLSSAVAFCSAVLGLDFAGHFVHTGTGILILLTCDSSDGM